MSTDLGHSASEASTADGLAGDIVEEALSNRRIAAIRPLISPALLRDELPITDTQAATVLRGRKQAAAILNGSDDRLLVIVGPCSVHDPGAALEYARGLARFAAGNADRLCIIMRVYFEKPRTTLGWKGLINDPDLDGTFNVNAGLRKARKLLLDILSLGLPVGCEFLDPITPQYIADAVSWGSIGARTAQSQVHRQLCSGLSMPIGIKNGTGGDVQAAVDAVGAAASSHVFPGITEDGLAAIFSTEGNPDCHVVLRGSSSGPNYDAASVADTVARLEKADLAGRVIIDASHGNSAKDPIRQPVVTADVARRIAAGDRSVVGVMVESFLVAGRQNHQLGQSEDLVYGQSITDGCLDWPMTEQALSGLAQAVQDRRG